MESEMPAEAETDSPDRPVLEARHQRVVEPVD
jgi:hypothetical protein